MDLNLAEANKFINYHAAPQQMGEADLILIQDLILKYPYCQSLHFLAAHASKNTPNFEEKLAKAATFSSNREALYQFINHTENFETPAVFLDESMIIADQVIAEETENINDFGQAFGVDLNTLSVKEVEENAEGENRDLVQETEETILENPLAEEKNNGAEETEGTEKTTIDEPLAEENNTIVEEIEETTIDEPLTEENNTVVEDTEEATIDEPLTEENNTIVEEIEETTIDETLTEENTPVVEDTEEATIDEPLTEENNTIVEDTEETTIDEPLTAENNTIVEEIEETTKDEPLTEENINVVEDTEETTIDGPLAEENNTVVEDTEEATIDEPLAAENTNVGIDTEETTIDEPLVEENTNVVVDTEETTKDEPLAEEPGHEEKINTRDELIFDSPVASDFFAFAKSEKVEKLPENTAPALAESKQNESVKEKNLSQYNDERLPYSFLWWLNKTRKEHEVNTQPYATSASEAKDEIQNQKSTKDNSLNHQIAENIFHLRGAEEIKNSPKQNLTVPFEFHKKEFQIIEKFIKAEPQIKPPAPNKIDTENKAKKSSEDSNEVVSETLAKIYVEQMLYHKALDVYKKLSLKYPEKSAYFASQIKYLELKVN